MATLIFATNNAHKVSEVKSILKGRFNILSLAEAGIQADIPEPYDTLEQNACEKARVIHYLTNEDCFAEDTGLEVDALDGKPGVKSARYAGENRSSDDNIDKLLSELGTTTNTSAQFKTVICATINGKQNLFDGICKGSIIAERRGESGFGYDPVFVPEGATKTFAEMTMEEKNEYSHRRKAFDKFADFLSTHPSS